MLMMKCVVVFMGFIGFVTCCHNITEKDCPKPQRGSPCVCNQLLNRTDTVVCCNINNAFKFHEGMACGGVEKTTTKHLHIFNYTVEIFDANSSKWWHLESLSVTRGKFKNVTGQFGGDLECINFSNNSLLSIENNTFTGLSRLNNLDISANNLTRLPFLPSLEKRNLTLDVSGNQLLCKNTDHLFTMEPFNNLHFNRRNNNETFCFKSTPIGWFLSKTSLSLDQMLNKRSVEKDCPRGPNYQCNCSLVSTTSLSTSDSGTLNIDVDCAGRFLTELPKPLPSGTIKLDVSNNNITSLDEFVTEPTYSTLKEFLADNNKIASIKALEGSKFFNHFSILSLKDNQLRSIPTYLLSNAFDSLWDARHVKLGGNRLNCDCNTAQSVKVWLNSYSGHIPDYMDIFCAKEELGRVIDLDMNQVCIYQKDWTDYIYYIIAGEILLLILLFSKVTYDYWVFKTAGYLPWPASKMPKLPCDWVFET